MLDYVLEAQPISLVFKFALVPIYDGSDADRGHEQTGIADECARRHASDDQANSLASRFFDFATVLPRQDVSNFMAAKERKLGFVVAGPHPPGLPLHVSP